MDSLILLCNYRGETCGIRIFHNNSYAQLVDKLIVRWSGLKAGEVGLSYSLETDRFCMLWNDDDLDVMFELVSSSGLNRVKVSVFDAGSTSGGGGGGGSNSGGGGGGGSNSGCGGGGGDQQLAILRRDWKMDVDKQELEWVPSFCMHKETELLSAGWIALIREVRQKFVGGVVEFRDALAKYEMQCGFDLCAHAPNEKMFDDLIADLKSQGKGRVITFLSRLPKEQWACAFFPGKWYGEMCSNLAECFNNWIKEERHLPVTQLVDRIRVKMMENIAKRSQVAAKWNFSIYPNMNKELENSFHVSKSWNVKRSTTDVFEVLSDPSVMVNLSNQTCSCFEWQFRCFPCCHAVCAIYNSGKDFKNYVDPYYMVEMYREVYSLPIYPIPTLWKPAPGGNEDTILPPLSRKPSGRPRKKRLRSNGEKIRPIQCSRCGKVGRHNRKTCKEDLRAAD
ncbi:hypothetical protein RHMOL_Rhmol02G0154000 [Rhododendron molle]|uniref:Uncharacterized protein n=1 Tax=Rhododendron molle TaxID=49168 RepID=A0ACC0PRT9_RHOML|nr:hypothetical protein RHMOL_Rhmol02G0154000 [Rhododendron molle]